MLKVAVLMSSYNGEKYIEEQIISILNQKGNFELSLIVRDDGSTDKTKDILEGFARKGQLKWYAGDNIGPAKSFIKLIVDNSGFDYYAFSDQDDYWDSNKIQIEIGLIERINGPAIAFSNGEIVDSDLRAIGRNINRKTVPVNFESVVVAAGIQGCTMLWNEDLSILIRNKGVPQIISMHDSYLARVCVSIGGVIVYDNKPLIKYRQHRNNVMGISSDKIQSFANRIKEIFYKDRVSISDQTKQILEFYEDYIPKENIPFLIEVINHKKTARARIILATSRSFSSVSWNMGFKLRAKILLGNR